jgi:hypothetical protein
VKLLALLAIFAFGQAIAEDARIASLVQQADVNDANRESAAALATLQQAEGLDPRNLGIVLRMSKQYADLVDSTKPRESAKAMAEKALDYGLRATALDDKNAKAHLNLAICYSKLTDFVGNKTKVEYAKRIHDETRRSIELDATDDYAWHVMGRWHSGVANLNGVLKTIASFVYGGLPPASNEESVRCLLKAIEIAPPRLMHHAELAKVYVAMGKQDLAAQQWQNILGIRATDSADEQYQKDARLALEQGKSRRIPARGVAGR